jgi:curved DNA-binding protein CbpA
MKRSLYEMFGVPRDADQAQIDGAYEGLNGQLKARLARGDADAANESILLKDGYRILCDPARRAHYDTTLESGGTSKITFFPEDRKARSKLGIETIVLIVLVTVLGGIVYRQLTKEMEVVRLEHQQAVAVARARMNAPARANVTAADTTPNKGAEETH